MSSAAPDAVTSDGPSIASKSREQDDEVIEREKNGEDVGDEPSDDDDDGEDEEPRLKYSSLTKWQAGVYKNGDATSATIIIGDKSIIGTHGGIIHAFNLPQFVPLKTYRAHSASVAALSVSPPAHTWKYANALNSKTEPTAAASSSDSPRKPSQPQPTATSSDNIFVGSASIDGKVCVASSVDDRDISLRDFGRPIHALALSPEYRDDRSYLSGGTAGLLVLTTGVKSGKSTSSTNNLTAGQTASSWLGTLGLSAQNGTDTVVHSGEGRISGITWSPQGRYAAWTNEHGLKFLRTNLHPGHNAVDTAWKRIGHIDHPAGTNWNELSGVWRPSFQWVDRESSTEGIHSRTASKDVKERQKDESPVASKPRKISTTERLLIGWGDALWLVDLSSGTNGPRETNKRVRAGAVDIVFVLRVDCTVTGAVLMSPEIVILLAYLAQDSNEEASTDSKQRKGRASALQPELRLINLKTKQYVCAADTLNISRYETLSHNDYHLSILSNKPVAQAMSSKGVIDFVPGISTLSNGIWDVAQYSAQYSNRLLNSAASVVTFGEMGSPMMTGSIRSGKQGRSAVTRPETPKPVMIQPHADMLSAGMKILIHSPYDCVLGSQPTDADHVLWLDSQHLYEDAWNFLDAHPEAASQLDLQDSTNPVPQGSPAGGKTISSLRSGDNDERKSISTTLQDDASSVFGRPQNALATKWRRKIASKWIQQLVDKEQWQQAGLTCTKVLENDAASWEHWAKRFVSNDRFDDLELPPEMLYPPIDRSIYDAVLSHYLSTSDSSQRFFDLVDRWPRALYNPGTLIPEIEDILEKPGEQRNGPRFLRLLSDFYLEEGHARKSLRCLIQLQDSQAVFELIAQQNLFDAIADDIPGFLKLQLSDEDLEKDDLPTLREKTNEAIILMVDLAKRGTLPAAKVVAQLEKPSRYRRLLHIYFAAMWSGDLDTTTPVRKKKNDIRAAHGVGESRVIVSDYADLVISLFGDYDRPLFNEFLRSSQAYSLAKATKFCQEKGYTTELVYLLSREGRTIEALHIIIDELKDTSEAVQFAQDQSDPAIWTELLKLSQSSPELLIALLKSAGSSIDPLRLVNNIPTGLEIPGLKDGIMRLMKDVELQHSLSEDVARILNREVHSRLQNLRDLQKQGIKVDLKRKSRPKTADRRPTSASHVAELAKEQNKDVSSTKDITICQKCEEKIDETNLFLPLVVLQCGHICHLDCLTSDDDDQIPKLSQESRGSEAKISCAKKLSDNRNLLSCCSHNTQLEVKH